MAQFNGREMTVFIIVGGSKTFFFYCHFSTFFKTDISGPSLKQAMKGLNCIFKKNIDEITHHSLDSPNPKQQQKIIVIPVFIMVCV